MPRERLARLNEEYMVSTLWGNFLLPYDQRQELQACITAGPFVLWRGKSLTVLAELLFSGMSKDQDPEIRGPGDSRTAMKSEIYDPLSVQHGKRELLLHECNIYI
jgi:hypothetical protein